MRSLVSYNSKYDAAFAAGTNGQPDFAAVFTSEELLGIRLFDRLSNFSVRCDRCHESAAQIADRPRNIGLDLRTTSDQGAGDGTFKVPSLRNVEVRGRFMHDGRFTTLEEVIEFYDSGVEYHPHLDNFMRRDGIPGARPLRLNLANEEKAAMVAFLKTLTDWQFLTDEKFSDPFSSNLQMGIFS